MGEGGDCTGPGFCTRAGLVDSDDHRVAPRPTDSSRSSGRTAGAYQLVSPYNATLLLSGKDSRPGGREPSTCRSGGGTALPGCVVASNGNPSAAVTTLLAQLIQSGASVRYHGDFDAAGIAICRRMREFGCTPWMMDARAYEHAIDLAARRHVRLERDAKDCGPTPWDSALQAAYEERRLMVHEEFVLEDVLGSSPAPIERAAMPLSEGSRPAAWCARGPHSSVRLGPSGIVQRLAGSRRTRCGLRDRVGGSARTRARPAPRLPSGRGAPLTTQPAVRLPDCERWTGPLQSRPGHAAARATSQRLQIYRSGASSSTCDAPSATATSMPDLELPVQPRKRFREGSLQSHDVLAQPGHHVGPTRLIEAIETAGEYDPACLLVLHP